jgi:hypothetical protein
MIAIGKYKFSLVTLSLFLLYLCAFAIGIKWLREPDTWWQLRTGEWILENRTLMFSDEFSYTLAGTYWLNVKWGYEVIIALWSKSFGVEAITVLQSLINIGIVLFFIKTAKLLAKENLRNVLLVASFLGFFLLFGIEYRANSRPESFSHLFTLLSIYFNLKFFKDSKIKYLIYLVLLQIIWTNMHEAYAMGLVISGCFFLGNLYTQIYQKQKFPAQHLMFLVVLWLSTIIHPHNTKMLFHPLNIFSQVADNKFTSELLGIGDIRFWSKEAYFFLIILGISLILFFIQNFNFKAKKFKVVLSENQPLGYLLSILLFAYLATTAQRNIIFFFLVIFPFVASLLAKYQINKRWSTIVSLVIILFGVSFYLGIVSNTYYKKIDDNRDRFGFAIDPLMNPVASASVLHSIDFTKKKVFSDYLTSSFLLWKLQPHFKTFIDLRDLDIFPTDFFERYFAIVSNPNYFIQADSLYNFDYVVLYSNNHAQLHNYLYKSNDWEISNIDAVSVCYQKKGDVSLKSTTINEYEARSFIVEQVLNPLAEKDLSRGRNRQQALVSYYQMVNELEKSDSVLDKILTVDKNNLYALTAKANRLMSSDVNSGIQTLKNIISKNPYIEEAHIGIIQAYLINNSLKLALKSALNAKPYLANRKKEYHTLLSEVYKRYAQTSTGDKQQDYLNKYIDNLKKAVLYQPDDYQLSGYLGIAYAQTGDCDNAIEYLNNPKVINSLSSAEQQLAKDLKRKCGF